MSEIAIKVSNLSKRYRIGLKEEIHDTFVSSLTAWLKSPISNYRRVHNLSSFSVNGESDDSDDIIWALKNVSLNVKRAEVIGIIGDNGAGKTTLLKILSRITEPTSGYAEINGSVASLLEVGTGFHPELTGRENLYLNGAILGMNRHEINSKFDEIVDFSGVEKFIDTPVKRYSSGMRVRLAFSVAAHLEPEILLVDEVLAVGDAAFQKKCLGKMDELGETGRTVFLVSHNMNSIGKLCKRAILLKNGEVRFIGPSAQAIDQYLEEIVYNKDAEIFFPDNDKVATIKSIKVLDHRGNSTTDLEQSKPFSIQVTYKINEDLRNVFLSFVLTTLNESVYVLNSREEEDVSIAGSMKPAGTYKTNIGFPGGILNIGTFEIHLGITKNIKPSIDLKKGPSFNINDHSMGNFRSNIPPHKRGVLSLKLEWDTRIYE